MKHVSLLCLASFPLACGSSTPEPTVGTSPALVSSAPANEPAPPAAPNPDDPLSLEESADFCVRLHEEVMSCVGEFIDLNIELRIKYFPDFAARASDPTERAIMRRVGIEEARADGTGPLEPRRERCTEYARQGPPTPRSAIAQTEPCYAKVTCADRIECIRPLLDERFRKRAEQQ